MTLKEMRLAAGYTQQAVTEFIPKVTQGLISQWESGECCPQSKKVQALARLYGVTSDDILTACEHARVQRQNSA